VRTLCPTWQPCATRIEDLMSFYDGPTFTVLVKLRIVCFRPLHYWRSTTRWPRNAERVPAITWGLIIINQGECRLRTTRKQNTQRFCERYNVCGGSMFEGNDKSKILTRNETSEWCGAPLVF